MKKLAKTFDIIGGSLTSISLIFYWILEIQLFIDRANLKEGDSNFIPLGGLVLIIYFLIVVAFLFLVYIVPTLIMLFKKRYKFMPFFTITHGLLILSIIVSFLLLPMLGS